MQNSIYKIKYLLLLSWDWEAWCLTQYGGGNTPIPPRPPERNTAWNKRRKCFHCLGAPNNLIRPWYCYLKCIEYDKLLKPRQSFWITLYFNYITYEWINFSLWHNHSFVSSLSMPRLFTQPFYCSTLFIHAAVHC